MKELPLKLEPGDILAKKIGLDDPDLERPLIDATNGVIGQLMGTVRTAVRTAIRDGRDHVTRDDLVTAIDLWNVGHRFIKHNPLRHG